MAIRVIRTEEDPVLRKISKPVKEVTPKIITLIDDMLDTMYEAMGVGLAAPQVGILKRIVVIDVGEGPIVLINPEILETSGEQTGDEGCLSVPGLSLIHISQHAADTFRVQAGMMFVDTDRYFTFGNQFHHFFHRHVFFFCNSFDLRGYDAFACGIHLCCISCHMVYSPSM